MAPWRRGLTGGSAGTPLEAALARLRQAPEQAGSCLWLVGQAPAPWPAALKAALKAPHLAPGGEPAALVFDLLDLEFSNFEVILEALERELSASIASQGAALSATADGPDVDVVRERVIRPTLRRCPQLQEEIRAYAEALATWEPNGKEASDALEKHPESPEEIWLAFAQSACAARSGSSQEEAPGLLPGVLRVLQGVTEHAEQQTCPPGFLRRPTGQRTVPCLLALLDAVASAAGRPAIVVAFLHVEVLLRSLFVDERGEDLLLTLTRHLQQQKQQQQQPGGLETAAATSMSSVFQTSDGLTATLALSPQVVDSVLPVAAGEAGEPAKARGAAVEVLVAAEALGMDETRKGSAAGGEDEQREEVKFQWRMDQLLSHPRVLQLRQVHEQAPTAFAVVLWESLRYICQKPYLAVPSGSALLRSGHPIVEGLLHACLLEPRWGPTRLVFNGPKGGAAARKRLLAWLDEQHAKLSWVQRVEYSLQLLQERPEIIRRVDRFDSESARRPP